MSSVSYYDVQPAQTCPHTNLKHTRRNQNLRDSISVMDRWTNYLHANLYETFGARIRLALLWLFFFYYKTAYVNKVILIFVYCTAVIFTRATCRTRLKINLPALLIWTNVSINSYRNSYKQR